MSDQKRCPQCGAELSPNTSGGHCPNCLLQLGLLASEPAEKPGDHIDRYKLLERIGEGGYGVVYMAEQEEPVRRHVALKVIKLGMDTRQVIARFEAERQALALMDHPSIARILDAGATETGRPYFVMELVRGIKITEYCNQQRFTTRQRLELFIQVCQAVQHAHQKGIIHRDLKPSNILVTEHDGCPVPKIIDFGIAKATAGQPLTDKTLFTAFEQFIGTPAYMSPEQAGLGKLDIDTRSDIYSLGVLLYELLTGKQPFDSTELRRTAIDEVLRTIREIEPSRPSGKVTKLSEQELTITAKQRQTEPAKFPRLLRGDLDWIVMKCLEKERFRRYTSATDLRLDLERHLNDELVTAGPPGTVYRVQRMFRRQLSQNGKFISVIVVGAVLALVGIGALLFHRQSNSALPTSPPNSENPNMELKLHVVSSDGMPVSKVRCTLIVGGFPSDDKGLPQPPKQEDRLIKETDAGGNTVFSHRGSSANRRSILYLQGGGFSGATRFIDFGEKRQTSLTIVLFKKNRVTLRYSFQPNGSFLLSGADVLSGEVTLDPMDDGSYRPPANAFFSFAKNAKVDSSGVLDVGIALDERDGVPFFGGSNGRFDHCTDLGRIPFESLSEVDTNKLVRERKDTPLLEGHTYLYESNIYPPERRTAFTGLDVKYAKIFVQSIERN